MNKICKICDVEKPIDKFRKRGKYFLGMCRICENTRNAEYRKKHPESAIRAKKKYYDNNRKKHRLSCKKHYKNNIEKCREQARIRSAKWRENNREIFLASLKRYRETHKEEIKIYKRKQYHINKSDLKYRLSRRISLAINDSLKNHGGSKRRKHWEDLAGYNLIDLQERLLSTMPVGYTWEDFMEGSLHIDHIIPVSAFNFSSSEHIDFRRCWALDNLQLLPAKENMQKHAKLENDFQPCLCL